MKIRKIFQIQNQKKREIKMRLKIPIFILISVFLLSTASALTTYAEWENGAQDTAIRNGESINFNVDFFTMNAPMSVRIDLIDSDSNVIHTFLNANVNTKEKNVEYTLDRNLYLGQGSFSIIARGTDKVGSSQSKEITLVVLRDNVVPTITLNGANPQLIVLGNSYSELGASATDNIDGDLSSEIIIDSSAVNTNALGDYNVYYNVDDSAGNSATTRTRIVRVIPVGADTISPVVTIQSPTAITYNNQITSLSFIATDANLASCEYSTDNGATRNSIACASGELTTVSLTSISGANNWIVYATDSAGNSDSSSVSFIVDTSVPDTTAPMIIVVSPEDKEYTNHRITFRITTDEDATAQFSIDGGSRINMDNPFDDTFTYAMDVSNGNHTITFYAKDSSDNEATSSIDFSVNRKNSDSSNLGIGVIQDNSVTSKKIIHSESTGTIIKDKENASILYLLYEIMAIMSLGILIGTYVLIKKLKVMKQKKVIPKSLPYY